MATYRLIMKDDTYIKLLGMAAKEQKSIGKLINEVLDKVVESYEGGTNQ